MLLGIRQPPPFNEETGLKAPSESLKMYFTINKRQKKATFANFCDILQCESHIASNDKVPYEELISFPGKLVVISYYIHFSENQTF